MVEKSLQKKNVSVAFKSSKINSVYLNIFIFMVKTIKSCEYYIQCASINDKNAIPVD